MDFAPNVEQRDCRDTARGYLTGRYPAAVVAEIADSAAGLRPADWAPLIELGWFDPAMDLVTQALLAEQSGYVLHPVPWWQTLALLPVAGGQSPLAFAWYDDECRTLADACRSSGVRAESTADGWLISGSKDLVPDAATAERVVLTATAGDGVALFALPAGGDGVTITPLRSLDGLRRAARVDCADAPAQLLLPAGPATRDVIGLLRRRLLTLLAAEAVGVAARAVDLAAAHARVRTQFGRPIGEFQGVAFRVADSVLALELARTLAYRAAWLVERGEPDAAGTAVACALLAGRDAATAACEHAMQILGGIAMTWEHPVHRWYRRALWLRAFDAPSATYEDDIALTLLGPVG